MRPTYGKNLNNEENTGGELWLRTRCGETLRNGRLLALLALEGRALCRFETGHADDAGRRNQRVECHRDRPDVARRDTLAARGQDRKRPRPDRAGADRAWRCAAAHAPAGELSRPPD